MQIQGGNKRLFEDFDPVLWKEAEEAGEENKQFLTSWGKTRAEHLYKKAKSLNINSNDYYEVIAQLVDLCQNGPLGLGHSLYDKNWVNDAVLHLIDLYKLLIIKTSYWAFHKYSPLVPHYEISDFETLTKTLFTRFVLGDTPWAINSFKDQKKHDQYTYEKLAEIYINKRWHHQQEYAEELRQNLKTKVNKEDMKVVEIVLNNMLEIFPEAANQPIKDFKHWIRYQLSYHQEVSNKIDKYKRPVLVLSNNKLTPIPDILKDGTLLNGFLMQYEDYLEDAYNSYLKTAYKDKKYNKNDGYNFTVRTSYKLKLLIKDYFKRKEFNADRYRAKIADIENLPDSKSNEVQEAFSSWLQGESGQRFLKKLTKREEQVASLHFLEGMKGVEIAHKLNISKGRVAQLVKQVEIKIRHYLPRSF